MNEEPKKEEQFLTFEEFFSTPKHMKQYGIIPRFNNFYFLFLKKEEGVLNPKLDDEKLFQLREGLKKEYPEIFSAIYRASEDKDTNPNWYSAVKKELYFAYVYFRTHGYSDQELFS